MDELSEMYLWRTHNKNLLQRVRKHIYLFLTALTFEAACYPATSTALTKEMTAGEFYRSMEWVLKFFIIINIIFIKQRFTRIIPYSTMFLRYR